MTLREFIDSCGIDSRLVRAVIRQQGTWTDFKQIASDVANHGADAGWSGFIWHSETCKFARRNMSDIIDMAENQASEYGERDALTMITEFCCLRTLGTTPMAVANAIYRGKGEYATQILSALAWYALEEVSRAYDDMSQNEG